MENKSTTNDSYRNIQGQRPRHIRGHGGHGFPAIMNGLLGSIQLATVGSKTWWDYMDLWSEPECSCISKSSAFHSEFYF